MPTTYTHYKFGKEVLGALPRPLRNSIENNRELFDIGLHGPDILFYYRALLKNPVNGQGYELHEKPAAEFFEHGADVISKAGDPAAARAYIYGFICHFALDSECHPYIEKMMQKSGLSHSEIEMELDRLLMTEDYINPVRHLGTKHIHPSMKNAEVIAPFFDEITPGVMKKCMRGMIFYHKLFLAPGRGKRKLLFAGMKAARCYDSMSGMVISYEPNPECRDYCLLLKKLYAGAVPLAASLIIQYQKHLFDGGELPERFAKTFGAGDKWEELRL